MATDPQQFAALLTADVVQEVAGAMRLYGEEVATDLRESLSVPVQYVGSRIIRSKPGERPRKETGKYRGTVATDTTIEGRRVVTRIGPRSHIAEFLEDGTSRMAPRPHVGPLYRQVSVEAADRIESLLPPVL
jgi:hypothetical protein